MLDNQNIPFFLLHSWVCLKIWSEMDQSESPVDLFYFWTLFFLNWDSSLGIVPLVSIFQGEQGERVWGEGERESDNTWISKSIYARREHNLLLDHLVSGPLIFYPPVFPPSFPPSLSTSLSPFFLLLFFFLSSFIYAGLNWFSITCHLTNT